MNVESVYCAGSSPGIHYAEDYLKEQGIPTTSQPDLHTGYLLLDIPSFSGNGEFRSKHTLEPLLSQIPSNTVIFGGNLHHPLFEHFQTVDLLRDEQYLCMNAAITAHCALKLAMPMLTTTPDQAPTLIIGWGRIGKCLAQLMRSIGTPVTVAVRKPDQAAILKALGYTAIFPQDIPKSQNAFRLIINTVPYPVLSQQQLSCFPNCAMMDLASQRGLEGENILWARSLPGIHAPESSGKLIAETVIRYIKEVQT